MIELKKVNKVYEDGFQALSNVDVQFEEGKINVLIGPSGCGKTTTMKLLNRLVDYTDGEVLFNGEKIKEMNPIELRRQMGFVIQNIGLFPHMTIYNNVATVPKLLKWDKAKIKKRVIELLEMVNLDPETYMHRYPSELSGGQQQRIGVIRALAAEPSTILMDEPFSALDPISREQLQDELLRLQTEINKTIVFVTHDMDEALKIADHIILMKDGQVVQQGSPSNLLANPANDFVKEFIGAERMNADSALSELKLHDFVSEASHHVKADMQAEAVVAYFVANELSEAVVVDQDGSYCGNIRLYDAIDQAGKQAKDLAQQATLIIQEDDILQIVLDKLAGLQQMVPVLQDEKKVVGILDTDKLFTTLQQLSDRKRGEE